MKKVIGKPGPAKVDAQARQISEALFSLWEQETRVCREVFTAGGFTCVSNSLQLATLPLVLV